MRSKILFISLVGILLGGPLPPVLAQEVPTTDFTPYLELLTARIDVSAATVTTKRRLLAEARRTIITAAIRGHLDRGNHKKARAVLSDKKYHRDLPGDLRHALIKEIRVVEIEQNTASLIIGINDKSIGVQDLVSALQARRINVAAFKLLFDILLVSKPRR